MRHNRVVLGADMVTLKQFADDQGISYEAVRRQVVRYADDLRGHVVRKQHTQYLDDEAVAFLKERRRASPLVLQTIDQSEEIAALRAELEQTRQKLMQAQEAIVQHQAKIIELQDETRQMLTERVCYAELQDKTAEQQKTIDNQDEEIRRLNGKLTEQAAKISELDQAREEAERKAASFRPSLFGFYRRG